MIIKRQKVDNIMALILRTIWDYTNFLFNEYKDPRNEHYPLLGSPFPIMIILAAYLYFVNSLGPRFMENRKPFQIKNIINGYNIAQVLVNLVIGVVVSHDRNSKRNLSV